MSDYFEFIKEKIEGDLFFKLGNKVQVAKILLELIKIRKVKDFMIITANVLSRWKRVICSKFGIKDCSQSSFLYDLGPVAMRLWFYDEGTISALQVYLEEILLVENTTLESYLVEKLQAENYRQIVDGLIGDDVDLGTLEVYAKNILEVINLDPFVKEDIKLRLSVVKTDQEVFDLIMSYYKEKEYQFVRQNSSDFFSIRKGDEILQISITNLKNIFLLTVFKKDFK